jgi:hypothetical protein
MDMIEFLIWFYGWFFAVTIPAVLITYFYSKYEKKSVH